METCFELHEDEQTPVSTQVQLDAFINHMLGVQILHRHFVMIDVPTQAKSCLEQLIWHP